MASLQGPLAIGVIALSIISPKISQLLYENAANRLWIIAALLGGSGAGGALIGMYALRYGKVGEIDLFLSIMFSVLSLAILPGFIPNSWLYRPWAKEQKE
jgi:hypothetical protein